MTENKQFSPLTTFPRFSELAIELRIQIWLAALESATAHRVITVAINHHPASIAHSCLHLLGGFCGQHDHCSSYVSDPHPDQPVSSLVCMFNGYFSLPATENIEDNLLLNLSLACTESHGVFLMRYPETMTIYKEAFFPGGKSPQRRQVRCNPAIDTLLVKEVPSYFSQQKHPSHSLDDPGDAYHEDLKKWFPQRPDIFNNFRSIVSRFRHVVFAFMIEFQTPKSLLYSTAFNNTEFRHFLIFFESLEHLYLCSETGYATTVREWERVEDIGNTRNDSTDDMDVETLVGASNDTLNCDHNYNDYMRGHSDLSADSRDCCWMPMPKGFGGSWLFRSGEVYDKAW